MQHSLCPNDRLTFNSSMFFDCFEDAVCYMCGKGGVLQKTEKDGRETAFNEDSPIQPVNVQARLIFYFKKANLLEVDLCYLNSHKKYCTFKLSNSTVLVQS